MPPAVEAFLVQDTECIPGLFVQSDAPLSSSQDWIVPVALLEAMVAGKPLNIHGAVSSGLQRNLPTLQDIYSSWLPNAKKVDVSATSTAAERVSSGGSVFFSAGVDSLYSLLKHRESIDNLILVHGFDIPLDNLAFFERVRSTGREVAALFDKRLISVKTNLNTISQPCSWGMQHGAALAAVAHALEPNHSTVYVGATHSYKDLHNWGSHPLLDPLWSSSTVQIVHDGAETDRPGKLKLIGEYPEVMKHIRVCYQNTGQYNCGECEKCLRTMIALLGLGLLQSAPFPSRVDPEAVRKIRLTDVSVLFWRELLALDLPKNLRLAVERAIGDQMWGLPPHGSAASEYLRLKCAARQVGRLIRACVS